MSTVKLLACLIAVGAGVNAVISKAGGLEADCAAWSVVAIVALGVYIWARHAAERRASRVAGERLRMAAYRHELLARRDREAGR